MVAEPVNRESEVCQYTKPVRDSVGSAGSSGDSRHRALLVPFFVSV